jgi:hypothetical protein
MAYDNNLVLVNTTTATGSETFTALDLKTGTQRGPLMWARVEVGTCTVATNPLVVTFTIQHSSDNSTWHDFIVGADQTVTYAVGTDTAAPTDNIIWLPLPIEKRYIRLKTSKTGGTGSAFVINGYITNSHYQ